MSCQRFPWKHCSNTIYQYKWVILFLTSVHSLLSLISLHSFPERRWLCSPGSQFSDPAEVECLSPLPLPPIRSGWTWTTDTPRRRQQRISWSSTQQADSPACPPAKPCWRKTQRYWWFWDYIELVSCKQPVHRSDLKTFFFPPLGWLKTLIRNVSL